jgi:hypothetical protein
MERQIHGLNYEETVISRNPSIKRSQNYTEKWDAVETYNSITYPVSIKCIGIKNSIDFGDLFRQTQVDENFILYIGFWEGKEKTIKKEYKLLIKSQNWKSYFGNLDKLDVMKDEMAFITNEYSDDKKWRLFRDKYKVLYGDSVIKIRFKRDHKKQKRIQCSINKNLFNNKILTENTILWQN